MYYAVSDIHGCYEQYRNLLEHIRSEDILFVLGDVVDRGSEGLRVLLDMASRPNVIGLTGNHDFAAAVCLPWLMEEITNASIAALDEDKLQILQEWLSDGGESTLKEFVRLDSASRQAALNALMDLSAYETVTAGSHRFVLVHAGLDNFSVERPLSDYTLPELLVPRPNLERVYYPDRYLVFGHTPTRLLSGKDEIIIRNHNIAIDCGCVFGGALGCLCLDTLEPFYL